MGWGGINNRLFAAGLVEVASGSSSHPPGQESQEPKRLQISLFYAGLARPPKGAVGARRVWTSGLPGRTFGGLFHLLESQTLFRFSFEGARDPGSRGILMLLCYTSLEAGCWLRSQHPASGGPKPSRGEGSMQSHHSPHWGRGGGGGGDGEGGA